ncbi:uncharacterized protein LODBEIA_P19690 [Lodderomyces beijingensis]|uniref:Uncharacterized protein n=1 Tax=Lodderomyces beijingensis TaxID=1775926 RepID=A0ABP0ZKM0_9ASCO
MSPTPAAEATGVEGSSSEQQRPQPQQPVEYNDGSNMAQDKSTHAGGRNPKDKGPSKLLTLSHLRTYPLVKTSSNLFGMVPGSGFTVSTARSSFAFIRSYQPFKYLIEASDKFSNSMLDQLDKWIPSLQTVEVQDLTNPIATPVANAVDSIQHTVSGINDSVSRNILDPVNRTIIEPTKSRISDARDGLNQRVHDENGKGIVSSQADPLVKPLNDTLENFVGNHFPDRKINNEGGHSSEIARSFKIVGNIIHTGNKKDDAGRAQEKSKERKK